MRRSAIVAIMAVCVAAGVAACGNDDSGDTSGDNAKKANIAHLTFTITDYTQAQEKGFKDGLAKAGGGTVKTFNYNFDPSALLKTCQDVVASGRYNAIVISAFGPESVPCAKAASAANIPTFALEVPIGPDLNKIEAQTDGVTGQLVFTQDANIKIRVDQVVAACKDIDPCEVIAEISAPGDKATEEPADSLKQYPNIKLVGKFATGYDTAAVVSQLPDQLTKHPDVDVLMTIADSSATAAIPVVQEAGFDKLKITGSGGSVSGAKAIEAGTLFSTGGNFPQTEGQILAGWATKVVNGETVDDLFVDALTIGKPTIVNKDNVSEFTPQWGAANAG